MAAQSGPCSPPLVRRPLPVHLGSALVMSSRAHSSSAPLSVAQNWVIMKGGCSGCLLCQALWTQERVRWLPLSSPVGQQGCLKDSDGSVSPSSALPVV